MKHEHKRKKLRNGLANTPLLRKGGVHEKTGKAKRAQAKQALKKKVMTWEDSSPSVLWMAAA